MQRVALGLKPNVNLCTPSSSGCTVLEQQSEGATTTTTTTMRLNCSLVLTIAITVFLVIVSAAGNGEGINESASASAGLYWSTTQGEGAAGESPSTWDDEDIRELDGGFSSLDGMLQWAIGHSDPSKLKEAAEDVQRSSQDEVKKRHREIKELIEQLKAPSDAQLMRIAIEDLNNSSLRLEDHLRALLELSLLVEPIDNANDLHKLGGTLVVIKELNHPVPEVRTISASVIGKACQNNPVVQNQFLELGALPKLMNMAKSSESVEEVIKALFAISALIRNNLVGQQLFYAEAGDLMIQDMLKKSNIDMRVRKKVVLIVTDLAVSEIENRIDTSETSFFSNPLFLRSLVDLLASADLDLLEKVLQTVENILKLHSTEAGLVLKEFCELDAALEKMKQQLHKHGGEHAADVESLRREVEGVFNAKIRSIQKDNGNSLASASL